MKHNIIRAHKLMRLLNLADINELSNVIQHKVQQKEAKQFKLNGDIANQFNDDMQNYEDECDATEINIY
jgi:hypothetical protein